MTYEEMVARNTRIQQLQNKIWDAGTEARLASFRGEPAPDGIDLNASTEHGKLGAWLVRTGHDPAKLSDAELLAAAEVHRQLPAALK